MLTRLALVQAGGGLGLAAEALDEVGIVEEPLQQHLERHAAAQGEVFAEIDVGHAAAADLAQHAVAAAQHLVWLEHVTHVWSTSLLLLTDTGPGAGSLPVTAGTAAPAPS